MRTITATFGCLCIAIFVLSGCGKDSGNQQPAASQPASAAPIANASVQASVPIPETTAPPPPSHNYSMVDNGTYGYEPALSEDDVRNGRATKPLIMMRYEGRRNGTFVILILGPDANNPAFVNRVSCQAPCEFAKSETLSGDVVMNTETVRVTPDSIVGAMLQDAVSGQLMPYGHAPSGGQIAFPAQQPAPQVASKQAPSSPPAVTTSSQMWIGPRDVNLRSCPGVGCAVLIVIPKGAGVGADMSSVQKAPGTNDSWVQVTYSGLYCPPATIDEKVGCVAPVQTSNPVSGWLNYSLLSQSPQSVASAAPTNPTSDQAATTYSTSFDCSKARSVPEYLICHDPDLAASDRQLRTIYEQAKAAATDKAAFADSVRKHWNYREQNCRDKACLAAWYADEENALTKTAQTGDVDAH
jgi:hypothetical protein